MEVAQKGKKNRNMNFEEPRHTCRGTLSFFWRLKEFLKKDHYNVRYLYSELLNQIEQTLSFLPYQDRNFRKFEGNLSFRLTLDWVDFVTKFRLYEISRFRKNMLLNLFHTAIEWIYDD